MIDEVGSCLVIINKNIVRESNIVILREIFLLDFGGSMKLRVVIDVVRI